jgi:hypothetical protein
MAGLDHGRRLDERTEHLQITAVGSEFVGERRPGRRQIIRELLPPIARYRLAVPGILPADLGEGHPVDGCDHPSDRDGIELGIPL